MGNADNYFVDMDTGEYAFREGDGASDMYVVEEGAIEIVLGGKTVATLSRGDFFGEMGLLERMPRNGDARAKGKTRLLKVDHAVFDQMIRQSPEFSVRLLQKLSSRLRSLDQKESGGESPRTGGEKPVAHFEMPDGSKNMVTSEETSVGRHDASTGVTPDLDLSAFDEHKTTSRKHARMYHENGAFFLVEDAGTANGSFVKGNRVAPGTPVRIEDGDEVRFGDVKVIFRSN